MKILSIAFNRILEQANKVSATSIFLFVDSKPIYKKGGQFLDTGKSKNILSEDDVHGILVSFLNSKEIAQVKRNKELTLVKNFYKKGEFRVNIFLEKGFPSITLRKINSEIRDFYKLPFSRELEEVISRKTGLLIITGPNFSGKTSTVLSIVDKINKEQKKYIIGIENPIEHRFKNKKSIIKQRQLYRDVKSYQQGIHNCLIEDVDLAYFSENRNDFEDYILPILELASGNCLVILEMNAENAVRALENILNSLFKSRSIKSSCHILADALLAIITQKIINDKEGNPILLADLLLNNQVVSSAIKQNKIYKMSRGDNKGIFGINGAIMNLFKKGIIDKKEIKKIRELNYK